MALLADRSESIGQRRKARGISCFFRELYEQNK
ncbi:Uncharacterised protein [Niallia circulans]|jgi:hypothetical protein|nr:Uncharacterised protein [Niallia circulans]